MIPAIRHRKQFTVIESIDRYLISGALRLQHIAPKNTRNVPLNIVKSPSDKYPAAAGYLSIII